MKSSSVSSRDVLAGLSIMDRVDGGVLTNLSRSTRVKRVQRDAIVWLEGQPVEHTMFLIEGRLNLVKAQSGGKTQLIYRAGPDEVASFDPLLGEERYMQSGVGGADRTVVATIPVAAWRRWAMADEALMHNLLDACVRHHFRLLDRVVELTDVDVKRKLADVLFRIAAVPPSCREPGRAVTHRPIGPVFQHDLACLLGVRTETVSRALNEWRRQGHVELTDHEIRVVDGEWFEDLVQEVPPSWRRWGSLAERKARTPCEGRCEDCPAFRAAANR